MAAHKNSNVQMNNDISSLC